MALDIKQTVKLSQQLVITPQLQLAIKLLQLSRLELDQVVRQELMENPVLETDISGEEREELTPEPEDEGPPAQEVPQEEWVDVGGWEDYFRSRSTLPGGIFSNDEERPSLEARISRPETLTDHLLWQMHLSDFTQEEQLLGELIIGNLDENGYLQASLAEIAAQANVDEGQVAAVLGKVQEFEPAGVAARDLKECLLLQLASLGIQSPILEKIIADHLEDLERKNCEAVARALGISVKEVMGCARLICRLEPKPGRPFSQGTAPYIVPDVFIFREGEGYRIVLNEDGLPVLRINPFYRQGLQQGQNFGSPQARHYLQEKLKGALWLIRSIHQRQRTIYKVVESIVKFQKEFLDKGKAFLKPMVLREVAADIQMHESTVSRVTTNKYAQTPQGLFELKFFFSSGLKCSGGDSIASGSVKEMIRELTLKEDVRYPYSDRELVELLKSRKINIARRTVTKYRESQGILSSSKRKKLF